MTKQVLISIIVRESLQDVKDVFGIGNIDIQEIDESDFTLLADTILHHPENYTDTEKSEIAELWIDIVTQEILEEDWAIYKGLA